MFNDIYNKFNESFFHNQSKYVNFPFFTHSAIDSSMISSIVGRQSFGSSIIGAASIGGVLQLISNVLLPTILP